VPTLELVFDDAQAFQREYAANLANGGAFIPTDRRFELRDPVQVQIVLRFCKKRIAIPGEVVHAIPPEMASLGGPAGVAVQFEGSAHAVRALLEPLRSAAGAPEHKPVDAGRRRAPRTPARVPARIKAKGSEGPVAGHTTNLSQTGVLVSVPGKGAPVGERVRVALTHPGSGESMEVEGVVVREVESDGGVSAVAIEFAPAAGDREDVLRFVERIQSTEHTRRLGGISGEIQELGVGNLIQMFASAGAVGTLALHSGAREGVVGFEKGLLRFARLGPASGIKALVRLLGWSDGRFEFHATLDPVESNDPPLPLEAALLDAARLLDEAARPGRTRLDPSARPRLVDAAAADASNKTEAAVLDLVQAGFTVERILAVIPEPDLDVEHALEALLERGAIAF
jgi:Tfp pilus assembly protein PilZ